MSLLQTPDPDYGAEYSFAVEYNGPPVSYDFPCVVSINIERIPMAAVVWQVSLSDKLSLPVVQLLLALDPWSKKGIGTWETWEDRGERVWVFF